MEQKYGTVNKVYIPNDNKDIMLSKKIGFVIEIDNKLYKLEQDQNDENASIMKNDKVVIISQNIDNHNFIDIHKLNGDKYEWL